MRQLPLVYYPRGCSAEEAMPGIAKCPAEQESGLHTLLPWSQRQPKQIVVGFLLWARYSPTMVFITARTMNRASRSRSLPVTFM